jgi:hypothetical protein
VVVEVVEQRLTTGAPRSSWVETPVKAMAKAAMMMNFMMFLELIDLLWDRYYPK